jgi:hypothetical protein
MRYRLDPAYPTGRRYSSAGDPNMRASDAERNEVADRLSRHFSEGRLDQAEFRTRLDTAMSAKTQGDLSGLFFDLPRLAVEPVPPPPRRRRFLPLVAMMIGIFVVAGLTASPWPFFHVPWLLIAVVAFFFWHRGGRWRRHVHTHHHGD